jgi:hypothetical protein
MARSATAPRKRNDHHPNWKDNDPGNPDTKNIGDPPGKVVQTAQNIKNDVQNYRINIVVGQQWLDQQGNVQKFDQRVRIMPEQAGQGGTANPSPGYKKMSAYSKKDLAQSKGNINSHLESVKRLLKAYAYQRIDEELQKGTITGNWRAVIRVVPLDNMSQQDMTGCGCGCS